MNTATAKPVAFNITVEETIDETTYTLFNIDASNFMRSDYAASLDWEAQIMTEGDELNRMMADFAQECGERHYGMGIYKVVGFEAIYED